MEDDAAALAWQQGFDRLFGSAFLPGDRKCEPSRVSCLALVSRVVAAPKEPPNADYSRYLLIVVLKKNHNEGAWTGSSSRRHNHNHTAKFVQHCKIFFLTKSVGILLFTSQILATSSVEFASEGQ